MHYPTIGPVQARSSVRDFAERMEKTLAKHDDEKGGQRDWRTCEPGRMFTLLQKEVLELKRAMASESATREDVAGEAIDVANFAMMVHDLFVPLADDERRFCSNCRDPIPTSNGLPVSATCARCGAIHP